MFKVLGLAVIMASLSFGEIIIDLTTPENIWDHYNAALIRVDLDNYIGDGDVVESATLKFTDIQNFKEPEDNDILHIDLLQLNAAGTGVQDVMYFSDNQEASNYFQVASNCEYTWIDGVSAVGSYTDNNDKNAYITYAFKPAYWEKTNPSHDWRFEYWDNYHNAAVWSKYNNYTTEDFDVALNAATVNSFKSSADGWIGIGVDADCHYTGNLSLVVETKTNVPEPTMVSLLGCSLIGLTFIRRKRKLTSK